MCVCPQKFIKLVICYQKRSSYYIFKGRDFTGKLYGCNSIQLKTKTGNTKISLHGE